MATELGPDGFLPREPAAMASVLSHHGLRAIGGFTPLLLHVPGNDPLPEVDRILDGYVASGAQVLVLSAVTGSAGYDARPQLDEAGWKRLLSNLDRVAKLAAERDVRAVLHPHVGTMIETGDEVQQVLAGSSISLCLDTGHLLIGGTDPAELARQAPERIAHLHLKDVDSTIAARVQSGQLTYSEAVRAGNVSATRSRRRRRARDRRTPTGTRLRRLVHPRTGHDPHRRTQRRRACRGRTGQRRISADGIQQIALNRVGWPKVDAP